MMKAFIFNAGKGSRLGALTAQQPKALVSLENGETLLSRQLRLLGEVGIYDVVIATGYLGNKIREAVAPFEAQGYRISFVDNPHYASSNAIVSMALARDVLADDAWLVLHGDLVFSEHWLGRLLSHAAINAAATDATEPLNTKDFKARVQDGKVVEIAVDIFDDDCVNLMPFYKLSHAAMAVWLDAVVDFCKHGQINVYAENAANTVMEALQLVSVSYADMAMVEVDTPQDLIIAQALVHTERKD